MILGIYFYYIVGQLQRLPVAEIAYQWPMIMTIGAMIVASIVGTILVSIGTAVSAKINGSGPLKEIDRKDERDININRQGELAGYYTLSAGILGVIALAMLRFDQFWIANALYLALIVGGLVALVAKLIAYRRGF
ncbi:MAG: hypothetical protein KKI09_12840 [Spirochaetes bacterium]|nr:hypothetical protein [Spirochaetota bacterium]MBU0956308.1 hypothetical protein [Spirochaetota bacterium]